MEDQEDDDRDARQHRHQQQEPAGEVLAHVGRGLT
jgi:hypothetical protein